MAINSEQTFSDDISTFGSEVTDQDATNLPKGASPKALDVFFMAQKVGTRPALKRFLTTLGSVDVMSHGSYPKADGSKTIVSLDSAGNIIQTDVSAGSNSTKGTVVPAGTRFHGQYAFSKYFMTFFNAVESANFSKDPYVGTDIPKYLNALGNLRPLTVDAPGGGLSVIGQTFKSYNVVHTTSFTAGPAITAATYSDPVTYTLQPGHVVLGLTIPPQTVIFYTKITFTLASAATLSVGELVSIQSLNWATAGGPQFPNGVAVTDVTNTTHFKVSVTPSSSVNTATSGTFATSGASTTLTRQDNIVSAYLTGTTSGSPTQIQPGWFVNLTDADGTPGAVPDGAVPVSVNELFQAVSSSISGSSNPLLLNGTVCSFYPHNHSYNSAFEYQDPSDPNNVGPSLPTVPSATFALANNQGLYFNPTGGTTGVLSGFTNGDGQHISPMCVAGVKSDGTWDTTTATIWSGAVTNTHAANWCMTVVGRISVPTSGDFTFTLTHDDGAFIGFGNGATYVSGTRTAGYQTLTASKGYTVMANVPTAGQNTTTFTIHCSVAGIYPFEIDYCNWESAGTCSLINGSATPGVALVPGAGPSTSTFTGDGSGNITVTLPLAISGLPVGAWLYVFTQEAVPSTLAGTGGSSSTDVQQIYPNGWVQVTSVPSASQFSFFAPGNTFTQEVPGVTYDYFGSLNTSLSLNETLPGQAVQQAAKIGAVSGFQVTSVDVTTTPNKITWYQPGLNNAYVGTHTIAVQPNTQITGGPRSAFVFFINEDGGASPASDPINIQLNGGAEFPSATIPIGPPGTTARGIAFTAAYGSDYFVVAPATIPATAGNSPIQVLGTIVNDNTTTKVILDFSDSALLASIAVSGAGAVGSDFGDLTSTIVLPPCLGVISYNSQLAVWGELNNIKNFNNMGFDGGSASATIAGQIPLGWDSTTVVNSITPDSTGTLVVSPNGDGWAYKMGGSTGRNSMLSQSAFQDYYGAPILQPNLTYKMRFQAELLSGTASGVLNFKLYSPTVGVLASCSTNVSALTGAMAWYNLSFNTAMPASIPSDSVLYFYLSGVTTAALVIVDNLLVVNANQPVLNNQVRLSYINNEFGFDNENGFIIGLATADAVTGAFVLRNYLYLLTENDQWVTQSNNEVPSTWEATLFATNCGCGGPNLVATGDDRAWWFGRQGVQEFGGSQPHKISQEVQAIFEATNWNYVINGSMANDPIQKILYVSIPTGSATSPNLVPNMNYRNGETDPVHISPYSGRMIATDASRKWCRMRLNINSLANCYVSQSGTISRIVTFGGGASGTSHFGQIYYQDFVNYPVTNLAATSWNCVDDDYGTIQSSYQTYFSYAHDIEQQAMAALYRKLFCYMSIHVIGVGQIQPTPYVDALDNAWNSLPAATLTLADPGIDYEYGLNVVGNRCSFDMVSVPVNGQGAFCLTHFIISARKDNVFPVRGAL